MRIIAGKFKGMNIFSVNGKSTRPTTDYFREYIFSVYQDLEDKKVLDLFAGTGALGLEALSRGAKTADFVEMSNNALQALFANIEKTKTKNLCRIHKRNVLSFLKKSQDKYDVILVDPPYDKGLIGKTIDLIIENNLLNINGAILIEHSRKESIPDKYHSMISYNCDKKMASLTIIETNNENINITEDKNENI